MATRLLTLSLCACYLLLNSVCFGFTEPVTVAYPNKTDTTVEQLKIDNLFVYLDSGKVETAEEFDAAMLEIASLLKADDTARQARYLRFQCRQFDPQQQGQTQQAIKFASEALAKPFMINYPQDRLDLMLCQSWYTERDGDFEQALEGYSTVVKLATELQLHLIIADARATRGELLRYQGHFSQGLEDLITARALYSQLQRPVAAESLLVGIATLFRQLGDYENALKYYLQIEAKHIKNQELDYLNYIQVMIGIAEEELGNLDEALNRFLQAYLYWQTQNKLENRAEVAVNLASVLIKMQDIPQAMSYLEEAEQYITAEHFAVYSFMELFRAKAMFANKQYEQAHTHLAAARLSFDSVGNLRGKEQVLELESQLYFKQHQYQQAYQSLQQYIAVNKQLDQQRTSGQTIAMSTQFNVQQIERENQHLVENQKLKQTEVEMLEVNKLQQLIIIIMGSIIVLILAILTFKQSQRNKLLSTLAMTDHLTQLPNRRHVYQTAQSYFEHAKTTAQPFSIISFDADHFKLINDTHGHEVGDIALQHMAKSAQSLMRDSQLVGRTGGEEFLILLPATSLTAAMRIATQLIERVSAADYSSFPADFSLTISAGVATLRASDRLLSPLINRADNALYIAKNSGRNRVVSQ